MRLVLVGACALVLGILGIASAGATTAEPFAITHLVAPLTVKQNGPRATRKVYWQGNPTFPVTVHEHGLCPESIDCGPRDANGWGKVATTVFGTRTNPLVSPGYWFCNGGATSNYVLGIEDWLTDANGHRTAPVRTFWVCKTH